MKHKSQIKTKQDFLDIAKEKFGDRFDYSKMMFIDFNTKIEIICSKHGSFYTTPRYHCASQNGNCKKCCKAKKDKKYRESEKGRKTIKRNRQSPQAKEREKIHNQTPQRKLSQKKYRESEKGKISQKKHRQTDEYKSKRRDNRKLPKNKAQENNYKKNRRKNNPHIALKERISITICDKLKDHGLSKNGKSSSKYLPFSIEDLIKYLEKLFLLPSNLDKNHQVWMNWENKKKYNTKTWDDNDSSTWTWNLDHIIPQSQLPYSSMEDENFKKCWALDNLRPLNAKQNLTENNNRSPTQIEEIKQTIQNFLSKDMAMNKNIAILGAQFGDEAKGAWTHRLSVEFDYVIRFSGGANAGHIVYRDKKQYVHNHIPCIDWKKSNAIAFLGSGMVIDLEKIYNEIASIHQEFQAGNRIIIDPDVFIVLPKHKEEDKINNQHLGTTNKGIGPCYVDKMKRNGTKLRDLLNSTNEWSNIIDLLKNMGVQFIPSLSLEKEFDRSKLLFEGAQSILLDINHGSFPFVSCGQSGIEGIYASGFARWLPSTVYGVIKCYSTRVGEGPFSTEIFGEEEQKLREIGREYGSTTGRPRRVGWLDLPALKYAIRKTGINRLIVAKMDILAARETVPVCVAYQQGDPVSGADFFAATPIYQQVKGWHDPTNTNDITPLINLIEQHTQVKVSMISYGVGENDILRLE